MSAGPSTVPLAGADPTEVLRAVRAGCPMTDGWQVQAAGPDRLMLVRSRTPGWAFVTALLLGWPTLGLSFFLLLVKSTTYTTLALRAGSDGLVLDVDGHLPDGVRAVLGRAQSPEGGSVASAPVVSAPVVSAPVAPAPVAPAWHPFPVVAPTTDPAPPSAPLVTPPAEPQRPPADPSTGSPNPFLMPTSAGRAAATEPADVELTVRRPPAAQDPAAPSSAVAAPVAPPRWSLVLDDGTVLAVDTAVLVGRNPQPDPADGPVRLVPLDDLSVSKTHALLRPHPDGVEVVDRWSTNGVLAGSPPHRLPPGTPVVVRPGEPLWLGTMPAGVTRG